jgi:alkylation response protein AidB-like acyl-CoA dehydrogenase
MREIFEAQHESFRETVRSFIDKEIAPHHEQWENDGVVSREVWEAAGKHGLIGFFFDEEYGGAGTVDFRHNVVVNEELAQRGFYGAAFPLFNDMIAPYFAGLATDEQKRR